MQDDFLSEESFDFLSHEEYVLITITFVFINLSIFWGLDSRDLWQSGSTLSKEGDKVV